MLMLKVLKNLTILLKPVLVNLMILSILSKIAFIIVNQAKANIFDIIIVDAPLILENNLKNILEKKVS